VNRLLTFLLVPVALATSTASAAIHIYPVAWPKAGGGMIVAVPLQTARVDIYRFVGVPRLAAFDKPFPLSAPTVLSSAPAGEPIVLFAPDLSKAPNADEDNLFLLVSSQPLVLSVAADERFQPGSPDRIYFMPAETGTFRGNTFYGEVNGGNSEERIRVINLGDAVSTATISYWSGGSWVQEGQLTVPPGVDADWDPQQPQAPYRVVSSQPAFVLVGYRYDNATAPAPDVQTGLPLGNELYGFGDAYHLRAVNAASYVVETRDRGSAAWSQVTSGTVGADGFAEGLVNGYDKYVRIRVTGGPAWAIVGTASLLSKTEWNGYFLPAQEEAACFVGTKFFTNSSARTISMLPSAGTTVRIFDEATGTQLNSYTSSGRWEFHHYFHDKKVRVEFSNGPGSVLLVGTLNTGGCSETTTPGGCGILEGGYSVFGLSSFRCSGDVENFSACQLAASAGCLNPPASNDAGWEEDAGSPGGADSGAAVDGGKDSGDLDGGPSDAGTVPQPADGGDAPPQIKTEAIGAGCGCRAGGAEFFGILAAVLAVHVRRSARVGRIPNRVSG
jgi:hypothetical protein